MFQIIKHDDSIINRIQDNIVKAFRDLFRFQPLDSVFVKSVALVSGSDQIVNHKLSRNYIGFVVIKKNANADVWESTTTNLHADTQIILRASATVTVDLWVF